MHTPKQSFGIYIYSLSAIFLLLIAGYKTVFPYQQSSTLKTNSYSASAKIPIYFSYHISNKIDKANGPFTSNNTHPLLSGAIINTKWATIESKRGIFDWTLLDEKIAQWTQNSNQKIILKISAYDQSAEDENKSETDDNKTTPTWVYETVPRITFTGGGKEHVSMPKVWDENFYPIFEEFYKALADKYNKDNRVSAFMIGPGQSASLLAQGSKNGGLAFEENGWTFSVWEKHTNKIVSIAKKHFKKPLIVMKTSAFLNNYNLTDHPEEAKRIIGNIAKSGVWLLFRGLAPDYEDFKKSFNPELITYLGTLNLPKSFMIGIGDDWPLWVPPSRSDCDKGPTCGRDLQGYEKELQYAFQTIRTMKKKYPPFFMFQKPEVIATNPTNPPCDPDGNLEDCFYKPLYDLTLKYLKH